MATRRRTLLATTLLLGGGVLGACGGDPDPVVGDVVAADDQAVRARAFDVRIPTGTVQFRIRTAAATVESGHTADGAERPSVDGVRYLGIGWEVVSAGVPQDAAGLLAGVAERPTVALVGEGERIELAPAGAGRGFFVAVPRALPDTGHVEVAFDGVVQQVALDGYEVRPGDAAALYDDPAPAREEQDCSGTEPERGVPLDQTCGALLVDLPWAPGAGWAAPGATWAAIRLEARLDAVQVGKGAGTASYTVTGAEVTATLGGARPAATLGKPTTGPGDTNDWLVFPMPAGPADLVVSATYAAERTSGSADEPATRDFQTTATVRVVP